MGIFECLIILVLMAISITKLAPPARVKQAIIDLGEPVALGLDNAKQPESSLKDVACDSTLNECRHWLQQWLDGVVVKTLSRFVNESEVPTVTIRELLPRISLVTRLACATRYYTALGPSVRSNANHRSKTDRSFTVYLNRYVNCLKPDCYLNGDQFCGLYQDDRANGLALVQFIEHSIERRHLTEHPVEASTPSVLLLKQIIPDGPNESRKLDSDSGQELQLIAEFYHWLVDDLNRWRVSETESTLAAQHDVQKFLEQPVKGVLEQMVRDSGKVAKPARPAHPKSRPIALLNTSTVEQLVTSSTSSDVVSLQGSDSSNAIPDDVSQSQSIEPDQTVSADECLIASLVRTATMQADTSSSTDLNGTSTTSGSHRGFYMNPSSEQNCRSKDGELELLPAVFNRNSNLYSTYRKDQPHNIPTCVPNVNNFNGTISSIATPGSNDGQPVIVEQYTYFQTDARQEVSVVDKAGHSSSNGINQNVTSWAGIRRPGSRQTDIQGDNSTVDYHISSSCEPITSSLPPTIANTGHGQTSITALRLSLDQRRRAIQTNQRRSQRATNRATSHRNHITFQKLLQNEQRRRSHVLQSDNADLGEVESIPLSIQSEPVVLDSAATDNGGIVEGSSTSPSAPTSEIATDVDDNNPDASLLQCAEPAPVTFESTLGERNVMETVCQVSHSANTELLDHLASAVPLDVSSALSRESSPSLQKADGPFGAVSNGIRSPEHCEGVVCDSEDVPILEHIVDVKTRGALGVKYYYEPLDAHREVAGNSHSHHATAHASTMEDLDGMYHLEHAQGSSHNRDISPANIPTADQLSHHEGLSNTPLNVPHYSTYSPKLHRTRRGNNRLHTRSTAPQFSSSSDHFYHQRASTRSNRFIVSGDYDEYDRDHQDAKGYLVDPGVLSEEEYYEEYLDEEGEDQELDVSSTLPRSTRHWRTSGFSERSEPVGGRVKRSKLELPHYRRDRVRSSFDHRATSPADSVTSAGFRSLSSSIDPSTLDQLARTLVDVQTGLERLSLQQQVILASSSASAAAALVANAGYPPSVSRLDGTSTLTNTRATWKDRPKIRDLSCGHNDRDSVPDSAAVDDELPNEWDDVDKKPASTSEASKRPKESIFSVDVGTDSNELQPVSSSDAAQQKRSTKSPQHEPVLLNKAPENHLFYINYQEPDIQRMQRKCDQLEARRAAEKALAAQHLEAIRSSNLNDKYAVDSLATQQQRRETERKRREMRLQAHLERKESSEPQGFRGPNPYPVNRGSSVLSQSEVNLSSAKPERNASSRGPSVSTNSLTRRRNPSAKSNSTIKKSTAARGNGDGQCQDTELADNESPPRKDNVSSSNLGKMVQRSTSRSSGNLPSGLSLSSLHQLGATDSSTPFSSGPGLALGGSVVGVGGQTRLFVKPKAKSNRMVIVNAIGHCCLAGAVNEPMKQSTLQKLAASEGTHFMILFRDARCQFRAVYSFDLEYEELHQICGTGPRKITHDMANRFFKYNSGGKHFTEITSTTHLSPVVDAITIHDSFWIKQNTGQSAVLNLLSGRI